MPTLIESLAMIGFVAGVLCGNLLTHVFPMTLGMIFGTAIIGAAIGYGVGTIITHLQRA